MSQVQYNVYSTNPEELIFSAPPVVPSSSTTSPHASLYPIFVDEGVKEKREKEGREGYPELKREKGKESEEDSPYPPVEIWRPPAHKWYQKQIVGKTIGKVFLIGGGTSLYNFFRDVARRSATVLPRRLAKMQEPKTGLLIAGIVCVGIGAYFHLVKYLRDPKAIVKYRKKIFAPTTTFQSVVDEYGWNDLFIIATKEELCYKLYQEMQSIRGLYQICSVYKVNNLRAFLKHDVMRAIDIEARWEYDVTRAAEGTGPELGIVVQECGEFLLTASRMQVDKIRESLELDPNMTHYSFVEIFTKFDSSIRRIVKKGFLSTGFLRQKLIAQLNTDPGFKFSLIAKHRWIVDSLCTPQEVALAFSTARENCACIVTFLELYWTWPIEHYLTSIIPDELELAKLRQIHHEAQAYNTSMQNDLAHAEKRCTENVAEARRTKDKQIEKVKRDMNSKITQIQLSPPKDGEILPQVNEIYQKQAEQIEKIKEVARITERNEEQAKEDKVRNTTRLIEAKRIELHKEWSSFLAQRRYAHSAPHIPSYNPFPAYQFAPSPSAPPM